MILNLKLSFQARYLLRKSKIDKKVLNYQIKPQKKDSKITTTSQFLKKIFYYYDAHIYLYNKKCKRFKSVHWRYFEIFWDKPYYTKNSIFYSCLSVSWFSIAPRVPDASQICCTPQELWLLHSPKEHNTTREQSFCCNLYVRLIFHRRAAPHFQ